MLINMKGTFMMGAVDLQIDYINPIGKYTCENEVMDLGHFLETISWGLRQRMARKGSKSK